MSDEYKEMQKQPLWSDGKTVDDIERLSEEDSDVVVYSLHEDVLCLKEDVAQLEKEKYESIDAWNSQLEKASARVKELEKENKRLQEDEFQCGIIETENNILKEENAELKKIVLNEVLRIAQHPPMDKAIINAIGKDRGQSLAQHDKEVAVKALMGFRQYLDEQGFKTVQKAVINKYTEQLQEQE